MRSAKHLEQEQAPGGNGVSCLHRGFAAVGAIVTLA